MNPFDTLGLPPRFDLDPAELERSYRELQRALHPDRFAQASATERRLSLSKAVEVNEAYRVLKSELSRAEALLRAGGRTVDREHEKADPELLMEMIELREALSEARAAGDIARSRSLALAVERARAATRAELVEAFRQGDLDRAQTLLSRMRYHVRFADEVRAIEEEHDERSAAQGAER